jgi:glycerophosphoryl diester phosphodiesterase
MPRLRDLLEYIAKPEHEHIWLLLDIKIDNNADDVMRLIAQTLAETVPAESRAWKRRVVMGLWVPKFLPLSTRYTPGFPIAHIGFSTFYARQFLKVPNVSFNMLQKVLVGPFGSRFRRDLKREHRSLYVWTVNAVNLMKWSIQKEVDGVITDDPKTFKRVCDEWDEDEPIARQTLMQWLYTFWVWLMIAIFIMPFRRKFPETVGEYLELRAKATVKAGQL